MTREAKSTVRIDLPDGQKIYTHLSGSEQAIRFKVAIAYPGSWCFIGPAVEIDR
jgi:hypothetical protein